MIDTRRFAAALGEAGFDIVHPFEGPVLGEMSSGSREYPLLEAILGADSSPRMSAFLIGNTRVLWPQFLAARAADPALAAASDPIELYTETMIEAALAQRHDSSTQPRDTASAQHRASASRVFYPHRRYAGAFLPFQRLAVAAGLAWRAPTQLLIHPVYGPWFALRALVLVDAEMVSDTFFASPTPPRDAITAPCACDATCMQRFEAAQAGGDWRAWLAVRDACTQGREYRYSDAQIAYHYTKDPAFLVP